MKNSNCCFCNYNHCMHTFVAVKYNGTIKSLSDLTGGKIKQLSSCVKCGHSVKNINNMVQFFDPLGNYYDSTKPELDVYTYAQQKLILNCSS